MGEKSKKMVSPVVKIPKNSNAANAIKQAAEFLQLAILADDPAKKEQYLGTALRWLETTKVTATVPPLIDDIRIRK